MLGSAKVGKSLAELRSIGNQDGSFYFKGANFRLTAQVKRSSLKSCGKIRREELDFLCEGIFETIP